jgi:hypothetical protein
LIITGFKLINFRNQANKKLLNKINMKKTLLIIVLFIGLGNLSAQDSTNNTTWTETTDWIKKHKSYLKKNQYSSNVDEENTKLTTDNVYMTFSGKKTSTGNSYSKRMNIRCFFEYEIELSKLEDISISGRNITLFTIGNNVTLIDRVLWNGKETWTDGKYFKSLEQFNTNKKISSFKLIIADREMRERYLKAFQHLIYLAKSRRKEERKASGEKF